MSDINPEEQAKRVKEALFAGQKIQAIKLYREQAGVGLKEAKDAMDKLEAELRASTPESFTKPASSGGCAAMALFSVAGVLLFLYIR